MMGTRSHKAVAPFADLAEILVALRAGGIDAILAKLQAAVQSDLDTLEALSKALDARKTELDQREYSLERLDTSLTGRRETIDADTLALDAREQRLNELSLRLEAESVALGEEREVLEQSHQARSQSLDAAHTARVREHEEHVERSTAELTEKHAAADANLLQLGHREEMLAVSSRQLTEHAAQLEERDRQTKADSDAAAAARAELDRTLAAVRVAAGG